MDVGRKNRPLEPQNRPLLKFRNLYITTFIRHSLEFSTGRGRDCRTEIRKNSTGVGRKNGLFRTKMVYFFVRGL